MRSRFCSFSRLVLVPVLMALPASAQIDLRFDPPDTNLQIGQTCRVAVRIDTDLAIRTIDVVAAYDTTVLRSIGGEPGAVYTDSGIYLFDGFDYPAPGQWHGYAVPMGAGTYVQGPGELYVWEFEAIADGASPITTIDIHVALADGTWPEDITLPDGQVTVGGPSAVELPPAPGTGGLQIGPNPFNPSTGLYFELFRDGPVRLTVYDAHGRRIAVLLDGPASAGPVTVRWNGRDRSGRAAPSGLYFFRLESASGARTAKGVLLE